MSPENPPVPRALSRVASVVILSAVAVCGAVLFLGLLRLHPAVTVDQVVTFYVVPTALIAGLLSTFRLTAENRVAVALLMTATGVAVLGVETALVFAGAVGATPQADGTSPILDEVLELRAAGDHAVPSISGNSLLAYGLSVPVPGGVIHPITTGPANSTTVLCGEFIDPVTYRSDRYGFNNDDGLWDLDTLEVALVGDSYTHGVCVRPEHQVAAVMNESMPTLNLGMRGAGPFLELAFLREYASLRKPRRVVWIYYAGNDIFDVNTGESWLPWLRDYLDPEHTQNLADYQEEIDEHYLAWLDTLVARGPEQVGGNFGAIRQSRGALLRNVPKFYSLRRLLGFGVLVPSAESALGEIPGILQLANEEVAAWGGEFYVVYLPAFDQFTTRVGEGTAGRRDFLKWSAESGIPFLDLVTVFEATGRPREMWVDPRGHLSPEGYRIVADAIVDMIGTSH